MPRRSLGVDGTRQSSTLRPRRRSTFIDMLAHHSAEQQKLINPYS
jgi:hypothetical protein